MQLTIDKLVYGGDGLARLPADQHGPGKAVFVPFVLEGERIEASLLEQKRGFARGQAKTILQSSSQRVEAFCPYFQRCGGCHYQHASYQHQLEIKAEILKENLRRIAKLELETEIAIHPSPPRNYRNRSRLKVRAAPEFALGYYRLGSHELLPVEECPISSPLINYAIAGFWKMGRAGAMPAGLHEIEFFANAEDNQLLMEVSCAPGTPAGPIKAWADSARSAIPEIAGIIVSKARSPHTPGGEPETLAISGAKEITYRTDVDSYRVTAGSFFQVNRYLIKDLIKIVSEGNSGETALDLYAGVGLFTAALSRSFAQVIAVEASQTSYRDLVYNSPTNVKAIRTTTSNFLRSLPGKLQPEAVVLDPPRTGLGESVVRSLVELGAHRMVYISCDPATASRDLAGLLGAGYGIAQVHLVDLFPQTYHVESVFHLVR